jgi:hypothetical protein
VTILPSCGSDRFFYLSVFFLKTLAYSVAWGIDMVYAFYQIPASMSSVFYENFSVFQNFRFHLAAVELADDTVHQPDFGDNILPDLANLTNRKENIKGGHNDVGPV